MPKFVKKIKNLVKLFLGRVILFKRRFSLALKLLNITEKRIVFLFLSLAFVLLMVLLRDIYLKKTIEVPASGGVYNEGAVGKPKTINPLIASSKSELDLSSLIFSPLLSRNKDDKIVSSLAEDFSASADGKKYFLNLRENILWHDGEKFSGNDVAFTISLIQSGGYSGFLKDAFKNVKTSVDGKKLTFELPEANSYFPDFLTSLYILPKHILEKENVASLDVSEFNNNPVGTGPFIFEKRKDIENGVEEITLKKNKNYFAKTAFLDRFIFKFYENEEDLSSALKRGEISGLADFRAAEMSENFKSYNFNLYKLHLPKYLALFFNLDNASLQNSQVRYAFAESINKNELLANVGQGNGSVVSSPLLAEYLPYIQPAADPAFNHKDAAAIIAKLKFNDKKYSLIYPSDDATFTELAEKIKSYLESTGVLIETQGATSEEILAQIIPERSFDFLLFGVNYGYSLDVYPFLHSSQAKRGGLNFSDYQDVKTDRILQAIRLSRSGEEMKDQSLALKSKIEKDIPAIYLFTPYYNYASSGRIKGISENRLARVPSDRFENVTDWYIKTKRVLR